MNDDKTGDSSPAGSHRAASAPISAISRCLARAAIFLLVLFSLNAFAERDDSFATLKVGDHIYQNVTVTTKGKNFIIISHSGGITSLKLSQLPVEVLQRLGYAPPPKPKKHVKEGPMWAGLALPKSDTAWIKTLQHKLSQAWDKAGLPSKVGRLKRHPKLTCLAAAAILLSFYLFFFRRTRNDSEPLVLLSPDAPSESVQPSA